MTEEVALSKKIEGLASKPFQKTSSDHDEEAFNRCVIAKISTIFIYFSQVFLNKEQSWKDKKTTKANKVFFICSFQSVDL